MYYDTIYYLIAMLRAYGIRHIVASPGMQNAKFNYLVQNNSSFICYSVVDERSAAYVATGISYEQNEPVVITCTGATSSRNYLSAMTEAYYRGIPIIAVTFYNYASNSYSLSPQYLDRSNVQNDVKYLSVDLSKIFDTSSKKKCLTYLNAALVTAKYKGLPVHINCPALHDYKLTEYKLPEDIWKVDYYSENFASLKNDLNSKNIAIFIGAHKFFTSQEQKMISIFAKSWGGPVLCDYTSNYHGNNKILVSQVSYKMNNLTKPDIVIDIGELSGEYSSDRIFTDSRIWRISSNNKFTARGNTKVEKFFDCSEAYFFKNLVNNNQITNDYYMYLKKETAKVITPDLPLSNGLICQNLAKFLPKNSSLHVSILNSLRNINFFDIDESVDVNCNVGGFGIDGGVSTLVGQSLAAPNKKCFGLIGDLAFFYDMNILGNRHIKNNLRLIVVNNNKGEEFRVNTVLENVYGSNTDVLIAAGGHYVNGAKGWAESCNFEYLSAHTKEEFENQIKNFCQAEYNKPVFFEVFTNDDDEKLGLNLLKSEKTILAKEIKRKSLCDKFKKIFRKSK